MVAPGTLSDNADFCVKCQQVSRAVVARYMLCVTHSTVDVPALCPLLQETDLDIAGLPCQPNSRGGVHMYEEDPRFIVYILWAALNWWRGTTALILENVRVPLA